MSDQPVGWFENYSAPAVSGREPAGVKRSLASFGLFGPGEPVMPSGDGREPPRIFEYRPGINLVLTPRAGYGLVDFKTLRSLGAACYQVRLNIELIKRQVRGLDFKIVPVSPLGEGAAPDYADDIGAVQQFFETPDDQYDFDAWVNMLVEELLVTDAVTLYPNQSTDVQRINGFNGWANQVNGSPANQGIILELIDGATIRPLVDFRGRTPRSPIPAYIQMLYGMPAYWFAADKLIYRPLNTGVNTPYGTSPIEYMLLIVNLAMRRDTFRITRFTEGNIPFAFLGIPSQYTPEQFQIYWDAIMAMVEGNEGAKSKIIPVPQDSAGRGVPVYEFNQSNTEQSDFDKWLMQIACWAFGNSPSEFGLVPGNGLGGAGYMEGAEKIQYRTMIDPITQHLARLFTYVVQKLLGYNHLRFSWVGMEPATDQVKQAQVDQIYLPMGIYTPEFVQDRLGIPAKYRQAMGAANPYGVTPTVKPVGIDPQVAAVISQLAGLVPTVKPVTLPNDLVSTADFDKLNPRSTGAEGSVASREDAVAKFFRGLGWEGYG